MIYDNLDSLLEALQDGEIEEIENSIRGIPDPIRLPVSLPTFGGAEPADTEGIYSWDADRVLIYHRAYRPWQVAEWEIIDRADLDATDAAHACQGCGRPTPQAQGRCTAMCF